MKFEHVLGWRVHYDRLSDLHADPSLDYSLVLDQSLEYSGTDLQNVSAVSSTCLVCVHPPYLTREGLIPFCFIERIRRHPLCLKLGEPEIVILQGE